jgi:hypothetical protein
MPLRSRSLWAARATLGLAALDSAASGGWALLWPDQVFQFLNLRPPGDAFLLSGLGALLVLHAVCLLAAAFRPAEWGGLVWVPLLGRLLNMGVWLWLLGSERVAVAVQPALLLLAHEALWLPGFVVVLVIQRQTARPPAGRG